MPTTARLAAPLHPQPAHARKKSRRREMWLGALVVVALGAAAIALFTTGHFSWKAVSDTIAGLNAPLVIALMALLPLGGFSITIVYFIVGARFGPLQGLPLVAGLTAFHLAAAYWIARRLLRDPIERFLKRRGHHLPHLPPSEDVSICLLAMLVPGVPYIARAYLLALTTVKLRAYFCVCLPVLVIRSYVAILLGDLSGDPDPRQFALIVGIYVVKLAICGYILWRLRHHRHATGRHAAPAK